MSNPKRQRTIHATIKDPESEMAMFPTILIKRRSVEVRCSLVAGPDPGVKEWWAAYFRMQERAERLGQLLQARWFGTVTP